MLGYPPQKPLKRPSKSRFSQSVHKLISHSDEFVQTIFSVNLFGTLHVTQAILPYFRAQGSGTIAFMGAGVAWAPLPLISHYSASKAALDVFVEVLSKEVRSFGVRCVIFEPGGFSSKLGQPRDGSDDGFGKYHPTIADYQPLFAETMSLFAEEIAPNSPGDINKIAQRIVDIIKDEGGAQRLPWAVRVILGSDSLALIKQKCTEQLKLAAEWEETSLSTDFSGKVHVTSVGLLKASSILD